MAYTSHGYHIPFTPLDKDNPFPVIKEACGGPRICPSCTLEAARYVPALVKVAKPRYKRRGGDMDYCKTARELVVQYFNHQAEKTDDFVLTYDETYVVWFAKTLQNWKAMVSTTVPDGMYYEITYSGDDRVTYLDAYKKFKNLAVPDEPEEPHPLTAR